MFDATDKRFLSAVSEHLAEGARRALLVGEATDPADPYPDGPGLIIVSERWELQSATPGVERWLAELPGGDADGQLPPAVVAVAARARRNAEQPGRPSGLTVSRIRSRSGTWIVLHGACLIEGGSRRIAVIIEPAHPARLTRCSNRLPVTPASATSRGSSCRAPPPARSPSISSSHRTPCSST